MPESMEGGPAAEATDAERARRIAAGRGRTDGSESIAAAEEAELCRRYGRRLVLFGRRRLRSDDAAHDLAQDALLLTLQKLRAGEVREPERIGAFLLGVARTLANRRLERAGRAQPLDEVADQLVTPALEPGGGVDAIAHLRVAPCVEALPETQKAVVLLSFYAEQTSAEVAASLGLSSGNVRVLRHRGVARLRECLGLGAEAAA